MNIIVKGSSRKPRRKRSNWHDAKHLIQEARESNMSDQTYHERMHEICRDTPGDKCKDLRKARQADMEYRKERGL